MNYYFISGTSRGIGYALAMELLNDSNNYVVGIGRSNFISHSRYEHLFLDLSDLTNIDSFNFMDLSNASQICLINNAGMLGDVKYVGGVNNSDTVALYNLNLIAPSLLINKFVRKYEHLNVEKVILNVSSGAAQHPIDGWAAYCASKAALDMFSRVVAEEQQRSLVNGSPNYYIFSVRPGKVDTTMQDEIRQGEVRYFSRLDDFKRFKNQNELIPPEEVASKYVHLLNNVGSFSDVVFSISDY